MTRHNVVLTSQQEVDIDRLVKSGRYQNASEAIREGLRMIEQREREAAKRQALLGAARVGFKDDHLTRSTEQALLVKHR